MSNEYHIRELAYYLWISEGKPNGQSDRHWQIATKIAEQQGRPSASQRSTDPSEVKGPMEPEQPNQT